MISTHNAVSLLTLQELVGDLTAMSQSAVRRGALATQNAEKEVSFYAPVPARIDAWLKFFGRLDLYKSPLGYGYVVEEIGDTFLVKPYKSAQRAN
jgi:hypothetical protein